MMTKQLILLAVMVAACTSPSARGATVQPVALPNVKAPAEADTVVMRTNAERMRLGVFALAQSPALMRAAQLQAVQMAAVRTMAHELPGAAFPTADSRLQAVGYRASASGENVAEGYSSPSSVVAGWMTSPHHRDNIVSEHYTEMGAGLALASNGRRFWVQVFGRPR